MDEEKKEESTLEKEETKVDNAEAKETSAETVEETKLEEKATEAEETKKEETEAKEETKAEVKEEVKEEAKTEEKKETKEEKKDEPKIENITSKNSNSSKAPIIVGVIAILLIAIAAVIFYLMNMTAKPDKVFKNLLNTYKVEATKNLDMSGVKSMKTSASIDVDLKLADGVIDQEILDLINNLKLDMNIEMDIDKDNAAYNIALKNGKDELVNADVYMTESNMYAKLNGLLDKYLKLELTDFEMPEIDYTATYKSEKVIIESIIDALNDSLKADYFKQEKLEKDIKNTLILDNNNLKAILVDVLTDLKENSEFLKEFSSVIDEDEDDLKLDIEDIITGINQEELLPDGVKVELSIFTKKMSNDITRVNVDFMEDEEVQIAVVLNVVSDEEVTYEIPVSDTEKLTGSIIIKSKSDEDVDMTITFKYGNYIDFKLNMTSTYKLNKSENIELPDLKDAVAIEELSQYDAKELLENLQNNEALMDIVNLIQSYSGGLLDNGYGDDYGYDDDDDDDDYRMTVDKDVLEYDDGKISLKFNIPEGYELDTEYSTDQYKYFEYEDDDTEIEAYIRITYQNADDYFDNVKENKYEYKLNYDGDFYKNVKMSDIKEEKFGNNTVKYVELSYDAGKTLSYNEIYAIYEINDKYAYVIEIEALDGKIPDKVFESFATFKLKK